MAYNDPSPGTLKRKRRRRPDKPAVSARLILDERLKGETAIISQDLTEELYPGRSTHDPDLLYAAITPWTPSSSVAESNWTVLHVRLAEDKQTDLPHSTICLPALALGVQSFLNTLQEVSPHTTIRPNLPIEINISDVVPLPLETVYASLDIDALGRLEEVQRKFGGGFGGANGHAGRGAGKQAVARPPEVSAPEVDGEEKRKRLVQEALKATRVVRTGSVIPLPLTHPITHTSAPPARILACEPVSQGLLQASTRIVIVRTSEKHHATAIPHSNLTHFSQAPAEEDEDTTNEAFYSAAEALTPRKKTLKGFTSSSSSEGEPSSAEESNLDSDDSDDIFSLTNPGIAADVSGLHSALTATTPRPFGNKTNGISTPGSVFSTMTVSTTRGPQGTRSKVFRSQGLLQRIPDDLLHPKPRDDSDEECRVYIDTTALARLGVFSGDWVKLEPADGGSDGLQNLTAAFSGVGSQWRPVKVYGLPESMSKKPARYPLNRRIGRRDSISSVATTTASAPSVLHLSPLLLANVGDPSHLRISSLLMSGKPAVARAVPHSSRLTSASTPPIAKEVTLHRISTPLSTERALQPSLFTVLKDHFEQRRRVVKPGDLLAIPIDETLGRTVFKGGAADEDVSNTELLSQWNGTNEDSGSNRKVTGVAWFRIGDVTAASSDNDKESFNTDVWGGAASLDPTKTRMGQSGTEQSKVPSTASNTWPYYLGIRNPLPTSAKTSAPLSPPQPYISSLQRRLRELISAAASQRAIHLKLPPLAILLTSTHRNIGKANLVKSACEDIGLHCFTLDGYDILLSDGGSGGGDVKTEALLKARAERALTCGAQYTALCVRHIEVLNGDRMAAALKNILADCRMLIATTTEIDKIPDSIRGLFTHELDMGAPDESEREGILRTIVADSGLRLAPDVDLSSVAVKTAALVAGDLVDVVERAVVARTVRLEALASSAGPLVTLKDIQLAGGSSANALTVADFESAVEHARKNFSDSIGAPKIPNVQWSDVGGLAHVKDAVIETIQLPLSHPELFAKGLKKRSGILFYGPPGTGKTLLAKAIATEFSLNFFSVKGPELLNMYIGESEANVRRVFQRARDARPCVVFFDELDSVAPKRGNQGDSGGVMDRIVSQLLAELDGMSSSDGGSGGGGVFVIGATNRPDLLDQALLRPGRFDKMLYLGVSDTHEKQQTILEALTRKFTLDPALSLARVAETLPFTYTGADLYALCSDAMLKAITRSARLVDEKVAAINAERATESYPNSKISIAYFFDHYATDEDTRVKVTQEDFDVARRELVPSVSVDELKHYDRVRRTFEGGPAEKRPEMKDHLRNTEMKVPQTKMADLMKRGPPKNIPAGTAAKANANTRLKNDADEDDDYVVRTEKLSLDGSNTTPASGKGKGKGKAAAVRPKDGLQRGQTNRVRPTAQDEEDLYD